MPIWEAGTVDLAYTIVLAPILTVKLGMVNHKYQDTSFVYFIIRLSGQNIDNSIPQVGAVRGVIN